MISIKINRAAKLSGLSKYPKTWEALISAIPAKIINQCTSAQIAAIAEAMRAQYVLGHTAGYQDARQ